MGWASLVAQLVKNQLALQETWVGKIPGEGNGYPLQYSGLENPIDCIVHGVARVGHNRVTFTSLHFTSHTTGKGQFSFQSQRK